AEHRNALDARRVGSACGAGSSDRRRNGRAADPRRGRRCDGARARGAHLERAGFAAVAARGGQEGLRLVRELRPAAVTLDIMVPDLDGLTVLAAIKGDPALAAIPVGLRSVVGPQNRGYTR